MLWTAEAVEDLKKLALEGKSASHIAAALGVGSRNAVIGKASRIGIKLAAAGAPPDAARRRRARLGPDGRLRITLRPMATPWLQLCRSLAIPGQAGGGEGGVDLWRSRDRRDAAAAVRGDSRIRLPVAARRSEKRGFRLLRAYAGQEPVLLRRPLPDGLSAAKCAREAESSERPTLRAHREPVAAVLKVARRFYAAARRAVLSNTQMRPGASAPASRRVDADWIRRGRKPASRAVASR